MNIRPKTAILQPTENVYEHMTQNSNFSGPIKV